MVDAMPIWDQLAKLASDPSGILLGAISAVDVIHAIAKKSPPYLFAPYLRLWKEYRLLRRILHDPTFSAWSNSKGRYVALQTIKVDEAHQGSASPRPLAVLDVLQDHVKRHESIILLGEPGAGKTTAVQALTYGLAKAAYFWLLILFLVMVSAASSIVLLGYDWVFALLMLVSFVAWEPLVRRTTIPLFVEARSDYSGGDVKKWHDELLCSRLGTKPLIGWHGRPVLLIDGVNEVQAVHYGVFIEGWRATMKETHMRPRVVFTSRSGVSPAPIVNISTEFHICDLDDEGVQSFLRVYSSERINEANSSQWEGEKNGLARLRSHDLLGPRGLGRNPY